MLFTNPNTFFSLSVVLMVTGGIARVFGGQI